MKTNNRLIRINDEIKKVVSEIIRADLKDPRICAMTSVIKADTTVDLKHCKIYISVLGDDEQKKSVMEGVKNSAGYIRKTLAQTLTLRNTPELSFILDDSLEYGMRLSKLIDEVNKNDAANKIDEVSENE